MVTEPMNGAAVYWRFTSILNDGNDVTAVGRDGSVGVGDVSESEATHIQFAVAVRAEGWVGLGISEAGGMLGSDMALFKTSDPESIVDSYVVEDRFSGPLVDECQSWQLVSSTIEDGWLIVEMTRPLDTMDTQDLQILNDVELIAETRLIAAWGDSESVSYHGFNVGKIATQLYSSESGDGSSTSFKELAEATSDGFLEIRESNYTIPARDTTYHNVCKNFTELQAEYNLPDPGDGSLYFIGIEAILSAETEQYVHHFIVGGGSAECNDDFSVNMLWGWAPGEEPLLLPSNVGIPMFGPNDAIQSISIQIHYNNPGEVPDQIDSSGMRLYFSTEPRENEAAWLSLADPATLLSGEPIAEGLTEYSFSCDGSCSSFVLGGEPVTVIAESLHMHQSGVRMTNEVIRNGEVVNTAKVDVFEFDQQGTFRVPQRQHQIQPGDSFRTTCYYRDGGKFGYSSSDEMCIAFMLYYPAKTLNFGNFGEFPWICTTGIDQLPICNEELQVKSLSSEEELGRTFGTPPLQCMASTSDVSNEVNDSTPVSDEGGEPASGNPPLSSNTDRAPSDPSSASVASFATLTFLIAVVTPFAIMNLSS
mmetsp:Transcript_54341/g.131897  ORF Transcript_54341/g.131897 Transcript_54341/m.131897 type:complete len:591 (+) Transcript_54341:425-2197(+)